MSEIVLTFTVLVVAFLTGVVVWLTYRVDGLIKEALDAIAYLTVTIDRLMLEEPCTDCEDETQEAPTNVVSLTPSRDGTRGGDTTGSP